MSNPVKEVQEALEWARHFRNYPSGAPSVMRTIFTLADEVLSLRAQLADETARRRDLAVELTGTWAEQCAAMAAVVREVMALRAALLAGWGRSMPTTWTQAWQVVYPRLLDAADTFAASGFMANIELEGNDG